MQEVQLIDIYKLVLNLQDKMDTMQSTLGTVEKYDNA